MMSRLMMSCLVRLMLHNDVAQMRRKKKGPRSLREAEAEGLVLCVMVLSYEKRPPVSARGRGRGSCVIVVFVQDRGDRTRIAAMREAASHVERERKGEQHMEFHGGLPPKY